MKRRNRRADSFPNLFPDQDVTPAQEDSAEQAELAAQEDSAEQAESAGQAELAEQAEPAEQAESAEQAELAEQEDPAEQEELAEQEDPIAQETPEEEPAQDSLAQEEPADESSAGEGQQAQEEPSDQAEGEVPPAGEEYVIQDGAAPAEEEGKKRRRRVKEPMPRKKKIIIGVIAGVLAVAILAAIIVPVAIFFTSNQTVSSAEDLLAVDWANLGDKKVYLQKDITVDGDLEIPASATINLNKHTLTINGALKVTGAVKIGTSSGDGFNDKGALSVASLSVTSDEGGLEIFAPATVGEGSVAAGVFRTANSLALNGTLAINAKTAFIEGAVTGGENALLSFTGGRADITGDAQVNVSSLTGAYINVEGSAKDIAADGQSYVVLSGTASSVTGGKGVLALKNFECSSFNGMERLGIYVLSCSGSERIENVEDIFFIEKLDTPAAAQVDIRDGRVILTISDVEHSAAADFAYRVTVNDTVFEDVKGTQLDITSAVTTAGIYDILITAQGNFKPGEDGKYDIDSFTKDVYYIDSYPCGLRYEHTFTLDTPQNLSITAEEGGIVLYFDAVPFADGYNVYINDSAEPISSDKNEVHISSDLLKAGSNAIYVQAVSNNEQILSSSRALIGYVKYEKLPTPAVEAPVISGKEVAVGWTKTEDSPARMFEVVFTYNSSQGGVVSKTVYAAANTITVTLDDLAEGSGVTVTVRALGYGYYLTGDAGTSPAAPSAPSNKVEAVI